MSDDKSIFDEFIPDSVAVKPEEALAIPDPEQQIRSLYEQWYSLRVERVVTDKKKEMFSGVFVPIVEQTQSSVEDALSQSTSLAKPNQDIAVVSQEGDRRFQERYDDIGQQVEAVKSSLAQVIEAYIASDDFSVKGYIGVDTDGQGVSIAFPDLSPMDKMAFYHIMVGGMPTMNLAEDYSYFNEVLAKVAETIPDLRRDRGIRHFESEAKEKEERRLTRNLKKYFPEHEIVLSQRNMLSSYIAHNAEREIRGEPDDMHRRDTLLFVLNLYKDHAQYWRHGMVRAIRIPDKNEHNFRHAWQMQQNGRIPGRRRDDHIDIPIEVDIDPTQTIYGFWGDRVVGYRLTPESVTYAASQVLKAFTVKGLKDKITIDFKELTVIELDSLY